MLELHPVTDCLSDMKSINLDATVFVRLTDYGKMYFLAKHNASSGEGHQLNELPFEPDGTYKLPFNVLTDIFSSAGLRSPNELLTNRCIYFRDIDIKTLKGT